jgi:hypothetical protein
MMSPHCPNCTLTFLYGMNKKKNMPKENVVGEVVTDIYRLNN